MSDYRRIILDIYKEDIVNFIRELNRKTGAKVQHNFQILWKNAYSEGYHTVPVVSFSQEKKTQVVIGEISFYLTDSFELSLSDYQITFFDDLRSYNPSEATESRSKPPAFDDAISDLAWLFKEVSRVLDTLDFTFLISGGGEAGFPGFPTAYSPGFHPGNSQRRQNNSGAADRQKGYSQARKNISFQTASGGGSGMVTLAYTAPFRYYRKSSTKNEFYDAAPPWFDDLRDYSPPAAEKIKAAFQKVQQQQPLDTPLSQIWELLTEALYRQGYLEHACQQKQSGFRLNQYGECTYYSCPVRRRVGEHDGRCHYQNLDFKT